MVFVLAIAIADRVIMDQATFSSHLIADNLRLPQNCNAE